MLSAYSMLETIFRAHSGEEIKYSLCFMSLYIVKKTDIK